MSKFIKLAKQAVEAYVSERKIIKSPSPLPKEFDRQSGVFVSIHKVTPWVQPTSALIKERFRGILQPQELRDGHQPQATKEELRGCIGTFLPVRKNIAEEIIQNAVGAARRDPRFPPLAFSELPQLRYSVDILSRPEIVQRLDLLDPKKYGLIVIAQDGRRGLLLPNLEGVDTVSQQIEICKKKAFILPHENVSLQKFTVERHNGAR